MSNFANGTTPAILTLDAIREAAGKLEKIGPAPGPWSVSRDMWEALSASEAREGDIYLDARLPPVSYYEGKPKPAAPR